MFTCDKSSAKRLLFSLLILMSFSLFTACSSGVTGGSNTQSKEEGTAGDTENVIDDRKETAEATEEIHGLEENLEAEEKADTQVKDSEENEEQEKSSQYAEDTQNEPSGEVSETEDKSSDWDGVYTDGNTTIIIIYGGSSACIVQNDASYFVDNMDEDITENYIFSIMDDPEFEYHAEHTFSLNGDSLEYKEAIRVGEDYWGSDEDLTVVIDGVFTRNGEDEIELFDYYRKQ